MPYFYKVDFRKKAEADDVHLYTYIIAKKEQSKPGIKHPKNIHGLHQEDTVNIG